MPLLTVGQAAPDFTVKTTSGEPITLSDYRGSKSVVLYFYPEDDTPGCTIEACAFRDDKPLYDTADTVILGVSLDDADAHQRFTGKFSLNFPLLADTDGAICAAYGVNVSDRWPARVTYLIDKRGLILRVFPKVGVQTHSREILEILETR
jgi:peroxiredoxin Q/BCP